VIAGRSSSGAVTSPTVKEVVFDLWRRRGRA